jgi:hypothetical protein
MNHGLAAVAVGVFFLDDGRLVTGLSLLDHGGAVALAVTILRRFANGYARANRTNAYADLIGQDRSREGANRGGNKQSFPHFHPPGFTISGNAGRGALFPANAKSAGPFCPEPFCRAELFAVRIVSRRNALMSQQTPVSR